MAFYPIRPGLLFPTFRTQDLGSSEKCRFNSSVDLLLPGKGTKCVNLSEAVAGSGDGAGLSHADDSVLTPLALFRVSAMAMFRPPICWPWRACLFTAISYGKLVRPVSRSRFGLCLCAKAINPHVGLWSAGRHCLTTFFLPMINVLLAKIYLSALFPGLRHGFG